MNDERSATPVLDYPIPVVGGAYRRSTKQPARGGALLRCLAPVARWVTNQWTEDEARLRAAWEDVVARPAVFAGGGSGGDDE